MNKKVLITATFLVLSIIGSAQDYKEKIETDFYEYFELVSQKKIRESLEYLTPEFFELFPKDELIEIMEKTFNDPSTELEFKNVKVIKIDDAKEVNGKYYSLLIYSNQMNFKNKLIEGESEEIKTSAIEKMEEMYVNLFGDENVKYNSETGFFEIQTEKMVYAISRDEKINWKFLQVEKNMKVVLAQILPKELLDEL